MQEIRCGGELIGSAALPIPNKKTRLYVVSLAVFKKSLTNLSGWTALSAADKIFKIRGSRKLLLRKRSLSTAAVYFDHEKA